MASVIGEALPDNRSAYRRFVESRLPGLGLRLYAVGQYWKSPCPTCGEINWYRESLPIY